MGKVGRPKKEEKRAHRIGLSVTEEEYEKIKLKAATAKITVSDLAYRAVTGKEIVVPVRANYEAVRELNAIGRNINLIARKPLANDFDRATVARYLNEIREIKSRLTE